MKNNKYRIEEVIDFKDGIVLRVQYRPFENENLNLLFKNKIYKLNDWYMKNSYK